MSEHDLRGKNYWDLLDSAEQALATGDFPTAERLYHRATSQREGSPGRVFFTERLGDGLSRWWRRGREGSSADAADGRWQRRTADFERRFLESGERVVREGVRLAEMRPEDDAETNQPVLSRALFLVARSRLFPEETASAVPLLKGLFRTARRTGRPFPVDLIRHDIPLTEEDRLWLARKGAELLEAFVEQGRLEKGGPRATEWARVFQDLLQPKYFGSTGRLEEERCWLEAVTADRLSGKTAASVELYRAYLGVNSDPGPRPDEARLRLMELLGNLDGTSFPVPRYDEALGAMQSAGLAAGSDLARRFEQAINAIEYRRPESEDSTAPAPVWASVAVESDGRVAAVYWWRDQPRDVAFWKPGEDPVALDRFLEPCNGRILAADESVGAVVADAWRDTPAPWTVRDFATATLESRLPLSGTLETALNGAGFGEIGPWQYGWNGVLGHPLLEPPRHSNLNEDWPHAAATGALRGGLLWLAIRSRFRTSEPSLRAGIGELARRGDGAAAFLYEFLTLDENASQAVDASFEAWTLPLLWTRPDPCGWSATGPVVSNFDDGPPRPDLGRNDLAIVTTGDAAAVMAAWGDGRQKWRAVLDRWSRVDALAQVAGLAIGPVTLLPDAGTVHSLAAALACLEDLVTDAGRAFDRTEGLLPLFHWIRLVETHNGDLLDFAQVRPRPAGAVVLYDRYAELVAGIEREEPDLAQQAGRSAWSSQFSQRVRKSGLVAGPVHLLFAEADQLDSLWGVFEGSDASWVFLDSAAIHWSLQEQTDREIRRLHSLLHSRGRRHLSILTGAIWHRGELEALLGDWLGVFGKPFSLALTDSRPPLLRLADCGIAPDAQELTTASLVQQAAQVFRSFEAAGGGVVLVPSQGESASFWRAVEADEVPLAGSDWSFRTGTDPLGDPAEVAGRWLSVPTLTSLDFEPIPVAEGDSVADWARADGHRRAHLGRCRKLCSLELAALLAGPWHTVEILDTRWWRLDDPRESGDRRSGNGSVGEWTGQATAARIAPVGCRVFDLPGAGRESDRHGESRIGELVETWRERSGRSPTVEATNVAEGAIESAAVCAVPGVHLLIGGQDRGWRELSIALARDRERGNVRRWLLLVTDRVPSGAAACVARGFGPGVSVWPPLDRQRNPAAMVWVRPEDFMDPELIDFLAASPPAAVLATDVADWLPTADREFQHTALALRTILDCGAKQVVLETGALSDPWVRYLRNACGARVHLMAAAAALSPEESEEPAVGSPLDGDDDSTGVSQRPSPTAVNRRLVRLLGQLRSLPEVEIGGDGQHVERQLVSLSWLGQLSGLAAEEVALGVRTLRWSARLAGQPLSTAGVGEANQVAVAGKRQPRQGHSLLIAHRFAELEHLLTGLESNLRIMLPLWLGARPAGRPSWIDLEALPAEIGAPDLALLDGYLAMVGGTIADRPLAYLCPRGLLNSHRRLVSGANRSDEATEEVIRELRLFRSRIADVMESAIETGSGFMVDTGLLELRSEEQEFLALGSGLGLWRWLGPSCTGSVHLVDLLTLADSPTARGQSPGWELVAAEVEKQRPFPTDAGVRSAVANAPRVLDPDGTGGRLRGGLRAWLPGHTDEDLDNAQKRVADLISRDEPTRLLVLRGLAGSGRHQALIRGLLRGLDLATDPGEITIYCPDETVAAAVARDFLRAGWQDDLDLRVPDRVVGSPSGEIGAIVTADTSDALVVMCEVQGFEPEVRYRIAQLARGRRLLMTVDPAASREPWEHLFLTTPRADDVLDLGTQRQQTRRLWSEVRLLVPDSIASRAGALRKDRGELISDYSANLDQCLSRILSEFQDGRLPGRIRLCGPLKADLDYLGSSLRDQGWLTVGDSELDALLMPGRREVLAAATDLLALAGELALAFGPAGTGREEGVAAVPAAQQSTPDRASEPITADLLLPRLLRDHDAGDCERWLLEQEPVTRDTPLAAVGDAISAARWNESNLAQAQVRRLTAEMGSQWGTVTLGELIEHPHWQAWWYTMLDDLQLTGPVRRRPLVTLAPVSRSGGAWSPGGVYLCLGVEPPEQHYRVLSRITDSALILYQEKSPLPSEGGD